MADFNPFPLNTRSVPMAEKSMFKVPAADRKGYPNGSVFLPNGSINYYENNCSFYVAIGGTVNGCTTDVWLNTLLRIGYDLRTNEEIKPGGFNAICRSLDLNGLTNKEAANRVLSELRMPNGSYRELKITRIPYLGRSFKTGQKIEKTIFQFDMVE